MTAVQGDAEFNSGASAESLIEARMDDVAGLARVAWTLGDRHVPVHILPDCVRLRHDPALETLLRRLGARMVAVDARFDAEGGAYHPGGPSHHHHHHHGHRHHDDHRHDPRRAHDHAGDGHHRGHGHGPAAGGRDGRA